MSSMSHTGVCRRVGFALVAGLVLTNLLSVTPASADEHRDHGRDFHRRDYRHDRHRPIYVAPGPAYPAPPVVYGAPTVTYPSPGINLMLNFQ